VAIFARSPFESTLAFVRETVLMSPSLTLSFVDLFRLSGPCCTPHVNCVSLHQVLVFRFNCLFFFVSFGNPSLSFLPPFCFVLPLPSPIITSPLFCGYKTASAPVPFRWRPILRPAEEDPPRTPSSTRWVHSLFFSATVHAVHTFCGVHSQGAEDGWKHSPPRQE